MRFLRSSVDVRSPKKQACCRLGHVPQAERRQVTIFCSKEEKWRGESRQFRVESRPNWSTGVEGAAAALGNGSVHCSNAMAWTERDRRHP